MADDIRFRDRAHAEGLWADHRGDSSTGCRTIRSVLNTFVWQEYDLAPDHPRLFEFIEYWQEEIEGPLHSVRFIHRKMIGPGAVAERDGGVPLPLTACSVARSGGAPPPGPPGSISAR